MTVDQEKIAQLLARPVPFARKGELRREDDVFFIGDGLPPRETLETIFDSDSQAPAALFCFAFSGPDAWARAETLVRGVKKNFRGYLLGRFASPPSPPLLDRAYAAGIDLIDLPLAAAGRDERFALLDYARTLFPRWSVLATLPAEGTPAKLHAEIDRLLDRGVLPLVTLNPSAFGRGESAELAQLFDYLQRGWQRAGVSIQPVQPLLHLITPLSAPPRRRGLGGLLERAREAQLRTTSDLRRRLRVRQVEDSFESAGL